MKIPQKLKNNACIYWQNNNVTLEEASLAFGLSRATLSRALAEKGLNSDSFKSHKTKEEKKMLDYLYSKNIDDLSELKFHV